MYKDNTQNAKGDIFNKPVYILENSIINKNEIDFNITGDLNLNIDKIKNNKILLQFHSDKNKSDIKNSTCYIINKGKSKTNKLELKCTLNDSFNFNIIDGYSKLNNGNFFTIFQKIENKIEIGKADLINLRYDCKSSSVISTGGIIGIIIGSVVLVGIIGTIIFYCYKRKRYRIKRCIILDYDENISYFELFEIRFILNGETFFIPCKREDNFSKVEEKLFQKFPELRYKNIKFLNNFNEIKRSSTLLENNIDSGDSILIIEGN